MSDDLTARFEQLAGALGDRAVEAEVMRRLPPETLADVDQADLWRLVVPTSLGGHGRGVDELANGTRLMGQGCPASAWTISFLVMHNWLLTKFPAAARAELFPPERPWSFVPAPLAPTGTATAVDGGFRVSGRWEWATGICHADWVMVHAVQAEPDLTTHFALLPIADVAVDDVWFTSGMRATGSNVARVEDVFVPAHRTVLAASMRGGGESVEGDGMAGLPMTPVLALVAAAPALGAAEAAVALYRRHIADRVLAYSLGERARDQSVTQARLGAVLADLAATRSHWDRAVAELAASHTTGVALTLDQRIGMRLAASSTVRGARRVIASVAEGSGASVYVSDSPLQRLQRDVEVLKGHVIFDWDRTTELAGKLSLGGEPGPTDMV